MRAAVYKGDSVVAVEHVPTPEIGPGELLVRVEACGVCHTDLKKIEYNLLAPPRIYGHETAGVVARVGRGVRNFAPGDRVVVFHHIPCSHCFYCRKKLFAQCPVYKKVGVTAGFEPAGGGFSQFVRVMDWIVERGVEKIPDGVSFERASFVEPVNTCLKAVVQCAPEPGEVALILGQGPIGLLFTMLLRRAGAHVVTSDTIPSRRALSLRCGAEQVLDPRADDVAAHCGFVDRWPRCGSGDSGGSGSRVSSSRPCGVRVQARGFCCLRKPPTRRKLRFPALPFAWGSALFSVVTVLRSICKKNPQRWFFPVSYRSICSFRTGSRWLRYVQPLI